jgi:hypothetical protein
LADDADPLPVLVFVRLPRLEVEEPEPPALLLFDPELLASFDDDGDSFSGLLLLADLPPVSRAPDSWTEDEDVVFGGVALRCWV